MILEVAFYLDIIVSKTNSIECDVEDNDAINWLPI